jgi:hypothetical protein
MHDPPGEQRHQHGHDHGVRHDSRRGELLEPGEHRGRDVCLDAEHAPRERHPDWIAVTQHVEQRARLVEAPELDRIPLPDQAKILDEDTAALDELRPAWRRPRRRRLRPPIHPGRHVSPGGLAHFGACHGHDRRGR